MNRVRPCEHETSASSLELNAVQTMAAVTAPCSSLCLLQPNLSLLAQSQMPVSRLVSTHLLQPGRPLFGSLRGQSLVPDSTHLLQPGCPLLGSLRDQSLVLLALICCSLAILYIHIAHPRVRLHIHVGLAHARPNYKGNYKLILQRSL